MDGKEKSNIKIENKPVIPDFNITDFSKEANNVESLQNLINSLDEKGIEDRKRMANKEIRYWILTFLLMALSFLAGKFL